MSKGFEIQVFNRYENKIEREMVYGDGAIRFAYGNPIGRMLGPVIASKMFSRLYGNAQDSLKSAQKVPPFLKQFNIQIDQYRKGSLKENPIESLAIISGPPIKLSANPLSPIRSTARSIDPFTGMVRSSVIASWPK